ncbi:O-antigen ligase family protein [Collimonas humicola]|uniref:O-antigen ligase family protein n=1 Tax=Collimonas humicola TaxID=2825886 RepID=UPI001B8C47BD|nr:O-antigen ligase family protein [Collimonas humicola]
MLQRIHHWLSPKIAVSYLIAVAAIVSPLWFFPLMSAVGFHDKQRVVEVSCTVFTAIFIAIWLVRNDVASRLHNALLIKLLAVFFLLGIISSAHAYSSRHAFFEWANFLLLFMISYVIALEIAIRGEASLDQILRLCGLGCGFYIFIEIISYIAILVVGHQSPNEMLIFGFDNYRFFNHVQTITLPLLGLLIYRSNAGKEKIFAWGVTSVWWALLFVSAGRGTSIGLLAGICAALFYLRKDALPWCRLMLWTALIGLGVYLLFYVLIPLALGLQPFGFLFSVVGRTIENPDSSRWPLWMRAWEIMLARPWLGAGPLHFAHFGRDIQGGAHPHNWVLQIACEWGIPALLCLVAAIAIGLKRLLSIHQYLAPTDIKNHLTLAAWLTTGVAILMDGLVSGLIVMPTSQLWIALYIGCAWGWVVSLTPSRAEARLQLFMPVRACGVIVMLAAIYFLANGLWPEILNLPLYEEQSLQRDLYANPAYRPRIWLGGYF